MIHHVFHYDGDAASDGSGCGCGLLILIGFLLWLFVPSDTWDQIGEVLMYLLLGVGVLGLLAIANIKK